MKVVDLIPGYFETQTISNLAISAISWLFPISAINLAISRHSLEHGLDVAADERGQQRGAQAGRHQVQQRRLRVLVHVHDEDGGHEAGEVGQERQVEVHLRAALQAENGAIRRR